MTTTATTLDELLVNAQRAKLAGNHALALQLTDQLLAASPGHDVATRFRTALLASPNAPFTYTRVMDFLLRKNMGFNEQYVSTENLIRRHNLKTGVELGTLYGYHAQHLVEACPSLFLIGVDAFRKLRPGNGYDDVSQQWFDDLCARTRSLLEPTGRWRLMRQTTVEAAHTFPRAKPVDFVFIDADHGYEGVRDDLEAWWPHVRPGGLVMGHDFDQPEWPGVRKAVEECLSRRSLTPNVEPGHVWWVKKPA